MLSRFGCIAFLVAASCGKSRADAREAGVLDASTPTASSARPPATQDEDDDAGPNVLREERTVVVDGKQETWRLVWRSPPKLDCVDDSYWGCPCLGFAFGEAGRLELVRLRAGEPAEHLDLGRQSLRRWNPTKAEASAFGDPPPPLEELQRRPVVKIMNIADYDHDGRATEFVLQTAAGPCFHTYAVLVGLERANDKLHVFHDAEGDITISPGEWEKVRVSLPRSFVGVPCGDHGATEEARTRVWRDTNGLRTATTTRKCAP
jgi:hypothetical protein